MTTPGLVVNPTVIRMSSADHNALVPGTTNPAITEYLIWLFAEGVDPATGGQPMTTITILKGSMSAVPGGGAVPCYQGAPTELLGIPIGVRFKAAVKARRTTPDLAEAAWSPLSADPFTRPAAPPAAVSGVQLLVK